MSSSPNKQVLYVDVDDEITAIIDKVNNSSAKVVALVLPKRAAVFQSVVNMKLLKRRADAAKKHVVLITSEASLMPLAGLAGLHVAPTPQSKPRIPVASAGAAASLADSGADAVDDDGLDDDEPSDDYDADASAHRPIGELAAAGGAGAVGRGMAGNVEDTVELDNTANGLTNRLRPGTGAGKTDKAAGITDKAAKADKKLRVPNFFSFRKRLMLGGLAVVLLAVGWYYAYVVLPKASITITTDSSDVYNTLDLSLDTSAKQSDTTKLVIPAATKQEQKSNTQQMPATGQQNKGDKATGAVTMSVPCSAVSGDPIKIPAGTGISSKGLVFLTQTAVELNNPVFSGGCKFTGSTNVTAEKPGSAYNLAAGDFTVSGFSSVTATSSNAMTGGTDKNVKVVQQTDIDAAKQKLTAAQDQDAIKRQLQQELETDSYMAITSTFNAGDPNVSSSSQVGDEADTVTVTQSTTYTMFGVHQSDLDPIVEAAVKKQIDTTKQSILNNGVKEAHYTVPEAGAGPQLKVAMTVTSTAGPKLDVNVIKQEARGLKSGEVRDKIKQHVGVKDAKVSYSPFWVSKAPKASRITVVFQKASGSDGASGSGQ